MQKLTTSFLAVAALALAAVTTTPVKLTEKQMKKITAGKIEQINGGGNTPKGEANGVPAKNPAGHEPGGHNK